ncbi:MAG: LysE family transporter [Pseudomonadota bacterium]
MDALQVLAAFGPALAGTVLAQASPGPNLVAVAAAALAQGRAAGLAVVAGVASGVLVWAGAVALGLGALLAAYPGLLTAMKLMGGAYLLYLSFRALRAAWRGTGPATLSPGARRSLARHWRTGMLVVLTNPKAALMWAAVAAFLFGQGLGGWEVLAFGPVGALSATLIYGGYALLFSTGLATRLYARAARAIEAAFGAVFGAMGAALALDGLRAAR